MSGVTGVDVEHTKAPTDAEIDADLVSDGGMYFEPDAGYPEYGNDTVRWAYRLGHEAGGAELPALVAAVERVQALHTPVCEHSGANCKEEDCCMLICQECGTDYPCETRKAVEAP